MTETLRTFADNLADVIGRPTTLRPFVCEGDPLACKVFLVGFNPATEMEKDFWHYWTDRGFERQRWVSDYMLERAARPLSAGKQSRP